MQLLGALLILVVLLDVFLTVLYARIGAGSSGNRVATPFGGSFGSSPNLWVNGAEVLSFCGPTSWVPRRRLGPSPHAGYGLIFQAGARQAVRSSIGPTPTDFLSALIARRQQLAIVSSSTFLPHARHFRCFTFSNSLVRRIGSGVDAHLI